MYTTEGVPLHGEPTSCIELIQAITGGPNTMKDGSPGEQEDRRVEHIIPADAVRSGSYTCFIEVTCNGMFGLGPYRYLHPDVRACRVCVRKAQRSEELTDRRTAPFH